MNLLVDFPLYTFRLVTVYDRLYMANIFMNFKLLRFLQFPQCYDIYNLRFIGYILYMGIMKWVI